MENEYVTQAFLDHEEFIGSVWWDSNPSSEECKGALREVSSAIIGCLHARNAGCKNPDNLLLLAKQAEKDLRNIFEYSRGLRVLPVDNSCVFYIPYNTECTVEIIRVMYSGRNLKFLLKRQKET